MSIWKLIILPFSVSFKKCYSLFVLQSKKKQLCERAAEVDSDNPFNSCTMMEHHYFTTTRSKIFTLNEYHKYNQNCTQVTQVKRHHWHQIPYIKATCQKLLTKTHFAKKSSTFSKTVFQHVARERPPTI